MSRVCEWTLMVFECGRDGRLACHSEETRNRSTWWYDACWCKRVDSIVTRTSELVLSVSFKLMQQSEQVDATYDPDSDSKTPKTGYRLLRTEASRARYEWLGHGATTSICLEVVVEVAKLQHSDRSLSWARHGVRWVVLPCTQSY